MTLVKLARLPRLNLKEMQRKQLALEAMVKEIQDDKSKMVTPYLTQEQIDRAFPDCVPRPQGRFKLGDMVRKVKGSQWTGRIVGRYSTKLTPVGWAVESSTERGSVQIYPEAALELVPPIEPENEKLQAEMELAALRRDAARLTFMSNNPDMVFNIGTFWYYKTGYGMPVKRKRGLREAIDEAMKAEQGK